MEIEPRWSAQFTVSRRRRIAISFSWTARPFSGAGWWRDRGARGGLAGEMQVIHRARHGNPGREPPDYARAADRNGGLVQVLSRQAGPRRGPDQTNRRDTMQEDQDSRGSNRRRVGLIAVLVAGAVLATGLAGFAVFSHAQGAGASQLAKPQDQGAGSADSPSTQNGGTDPASSGQGDDPSSYPG